MTSRKIKWLSAALALAMTLSFTACSKSTTDDSSSNSSDTSGSEEQTVQHKVGYIFKESVSGNSYTAQICEQRKRASNRSSVETCYIENVALSDFEDAVKVLVDAGCTDIVSCSHTYANVLNSTARKYLDINFISMGALNGGLNVSPYSERPYQGAYVAGFVAEFNSEASTIGVITDPGLPDYVAVVNAVKLGSQLNPDGGAKVYAAVAEQNDEIEKAINELRSKGCDVIVCYTDSGYSADYCESKNIKFIGCLDYSENAHEYSNMLMYFYCMRDSYFLAQFKSMKMDIWETSSYIGDMSNSIINVSAAQEKVAKDGSQKLIDALVPHITSGSAIVFKGPLKDTNGNVKYLENEIMSNSEIDKMNWLVQGVETVGDFRKPQLNQPQSSFEIKD